MCIYMPMCLYGESLFENRNECFEVRYATDLL